LREYIFTTVAIYLTILLWIIIFETLLANMLRKSIDIPLSNPYIVEKVLKVARHNILGQPR
jgi:hypothetical protein